MIYLQLFLNFLQIGLLSIGGGYAAVPLIQRQVVDVNKWLTMESFTDLITISEMTPGPIAINSSTFVGMQIAGLPGAAVSTLGLILPSFVIVLILAYFYSKFINSNIVKGVLSGLRPVVIALIAYAGLTIIFTSFWGTGALNNVIESLNNINFVSVALFVVCIFLLRRFKLNPILVMTGSGIAGMIAYLIIHII